MTDPLEQIIKAQRIDFLVQSMNEINVDGQGRALVSEWLGELTADLVADLKGLSKEEKSLQ